MGKQSDGRTRRDAKREQLVQDAPSAVTPGTLHLAPFDADVPCLTAPDGTEYVPIRALCDLLRLAPGIWIAVVVARYRGDDEMGEAARRLPYRGPDGVTRDEWCVDRAHVVRWLSFDLSRATCPLVRVVANCILRSGE